MRFNLKKLFLGTAVVAFLLVLGTFISYVFSMRLVAAVDHPNGSRLRVVQTLQFSTDLFDTSIYFDDGDGRWRSYYFDHADWYWERAETQIEQDTIYVRAPNREIKMETVSGQCTILNEGESHTYPKIPDNVILPSIQLPPRISDPPRKQTVNSSIRPLGK